MTCEYKWIFTDHRELKNYAFFLGYENNFMKFTFDQVTTSDTPYDYGLINA